ncbi:hypothetical protein [Fusibacter sp. JL216-2]|uniref:hypothetical protein n=1 Tax=Fusibacter sp. JL216-2 TaxID=3071453 RepID=UPI003D330546
MNKILPIVTMNEDLMKKHLLKSDWTKFEKEFNKQWDVITANSEKIYQIKNKEIENLYGLKRDITYKMATKNVGINVALMALIISVLSVAFNIFDIPNSSTDWVFSFNSREEVILTVFSIVLIALVILFYLVSLFFFIRLIVSIMKGNREKYDYALLEYQLSHVDNAIRLLRETEHNNVIENVGLLQNETVQDLVKVSENTSKNLHVKITVIEDNLSDILNQIKKLNKLNERQEENSTKQISLKIEEMLVAFKYLDQKIIKLSHTDDRENNVSESFDKVRTNVKIINKIVDELKVISLNATIEAARNNNRAFQLISGDMKKMSDDLQIKFNEIIKCLDEGEF